jgi:hypothetical protein
MAKVGISLPNVLMRGKKKTTTRRRNLTRATRKIRNSRRRNLTDKLILVKNGTQEMIVSGRKVMTW